MSTFPFGMATDHRTVTIQHNGVEARIDRGIASVVLAMWKAGIGTVCSCEGFRTGAGWKTGPFSLGLGAGIIFDSADSAKRFTAIGRGLHHWPKVIKDKERVGVRLVGNIAAPTHWYSVRFALEDRRRLLRALRNAAKND
jgi:hypothetical protein